MIDWFCDIGFSRLNTPDVKYFGRYDDHTNISAYMLGNLPPSQLQPTCPHYFRNTYKIQNIFPLFL